MIDTQPPDAGLIVLALDRARDTRGQVLAEQLAQQLARAWTWAEQFGTHRGERAALLLLYQAGQYRRTGGDHFAASMLDRLAEACVIGFVGELEVQQALEDFPGLRT